MSGQIPTPHKPLDKLDKCIIHNQSLGIRQIYKCKTEEYCNSSNTQGTRGGPGGRDQTLAVNSLKIARKSEDDHKIFKMEDDYV